MKFLLSIFLMNSIFIRCSRVVVIVSVLLSYVFNGFGCTSAIVGADASASGRPLLWKHRDTSTTDNKIEYVPAGEDGGYSYVALFNANDKDLKEAWMGMNEMGFAVMNTASYNIKDDKVPDKDMDKEGFLMTIALRTCRTVEDFENLLRTLPRPMGVEANFGAIDALGNGAYFETNNDSFVKYDVNDADGHVLIRTNYSHSGRKNEGYGYVREANAEKLLADAIVSKSITPEFLTERVSRSFYHDVKGGDALESSERWIVDEDFIPRYKSTATIVIEGIPPVKEIEYVTPRLIVPQYIMWTGLGYPPVAEIYPVWCHRKGVNEALRGIGPKGTSPAGNIARKRRAEVFPPQKGGNTKYIDKNVLVNEDSTGFLQVIPPHNYETYRVISHKRDAGEITFEQ